MEAGHGSKCKASERVGGWREGLVMLESGETIEMGTKRGKNTR